MADSKSCENTQTPPLKKFCLLDDEIVSELLKIKSHYNKSETGLRIVAVFFQSFRFAKLAIFASCSLSVFDLVFG